MHRSKLPFLGSGIKTDCADSSGRIPVPKPPSRSPVVCSVSLPLKVENFGAHHPELKAMSKNIFATSFSDGNNTIDEACLDFCLQQARVNQS